MGDPTSPTARMGQAAQHGRRKAPPCATRFQPSTVPAPTGPRRAKARPSRPRDRRNNPCRACRTNATSRRTVRPRMNLRPSAWGASPMKTSSAGWSTPARARPWAKRMTSSGGTRRTAGRNSGLERSAHRVDHHLVVGLAEDRAAGHEGVGPGGRDPGDVVGLDPAVDFEPNVLAAGIDAPPRLFDLAQGRLDEGLATETGVDAHDKDEIDVLDQQGEH